MDHSFYAALHVKSIVVKNINLLQDITANNTMLNRELINSLKIEESEHEVINLPEIEHQPKNLLEIEELEHQVNNSLETEESNLLRIEESDYNSFINFLEEIKKDYENWDPQLCKALDKFSAQYKAAKTQSIPRLTSFLYDINRNSDPLARIKGGKKIPVQVESVK
ncbi:2230_t:CDS:2 [Gigaspora rosea]|nr:2230_t:CDS:2 [Gigaspora rosea]